MALSKITADSIADNSLTAANVSDGSITTTKLADSAVTSAKIGVDVIVAEDLAANSVTVSELTDGAVTPAKLSTGHPNWDSSGNVGIGTASPDAQLQVFAQDSAAGKAIRAAYDGTYYSDFTESGIHCYNNLFTIDTKQAQALVLGTNATERMRIDSSGNVGIGTTSMTRFFNLYDTSSNATTAYIKNTSASGGSGILCYNDSGQAATFQLNGSSNSSYAGANTLNIGSVTNNRVAFLENNIEKMRISGDYVMIGTTSPILSSSAAGVTFQKNSEQGYIGIGTTRSAGTDMQRFITSGGIVGTISANSSNTNYGTTSDYRLKENVVELTDGIERVKQLSPSRFNFIADPDRTVDGFVAHEVSDVVPEAIFGDKDGTDDEGNPKYQQIDQSKLVPLLTAALQEAITKIESLEARVATLESA
jgi:hypothetical protein